MGDPRRRLPRTDALLDDPDLRAVAPPDRLGRTVRAVLARARAGELAPDGVKEQILLELGDALISMRGVLNGTGVIVHTGLGRAPLSEMAREALSVAAGPVDVEFDLATGDRGDRGAGVREVLRSLVTPAADAHVVGNGAAALLLAVTALGAGREVIVSRGQLVAIGDGFRLPELLSACGARLREVGTTNQTTLQDYRAAIGPDTGVLLTVHPSNFVVRGYTAVPSISDLASLGLPVIHDIGSGLLSPHPLLPDEPDATTSLRAGTTIVTCSGDKLLGGPQAGLLLGSADAIRACRRHPLARALRVDKLTLAGLEATLRGPRPPVRVMLETDAESLRSRCLAWLHALPASVEATVVPSEGVVGGGGAPDVALPGWSLSLPEPYAAALRHGSPPVVTRLSHGRTLLDPRALDPIDDQRVLEALQAAHATLP